MHKYNQKVAQCKRRQKNVSKKKSWIFKANCKENVTASFKLSVGPLLVIL